MIQVGSKVKVIEGLTEKQSGIEEKSLKDLRGVETTVVDITPDRGCFAIALDQGWAFDEDWLEEVEDVNNEN